MSKRILKLTGNLARQAACRYINEAPEGHVVTIAERGVVFSDCMPERIAA